MALALFAIPQIAQADTAPTVYDLPGINLVTVVRRPDLHRSDWSRTFDLGDQRFSIIGARAKSARAADRFALMPDNKIKSWSLSGRYDHDIGALGTIGLVGVLPQSGDPLLLEALDRVTLKPRAECLPYDLGSLEPERLADSIDLRQRFLVNRNLHVFHTQTYS